MLRQYYQVISRDLIILIILLLSVIQVINQVRCVEYNASINQTSPNKTFPNALTRTRSVRLPNSTYPLHYYWHVTTFVHTGDLDFKGNITIDIKIKETTDEIVLNAKELRNFNVICFDLETGKKLEDVTYSQDNRTNFLIIHAFEYYQVFEEAKEYRLQITYEGTMQEQNYGLYWLAYQDQNNRTIYHAATQFEPTSARLALPCYDEPALKANFTIRITHGKIYNAISNMKLKSVVGHSDSDLATSTFYTTPPISTYLVAFFVSNFDYISAEYRNVTQRLYTPPTSKYKGQRELKFAIRIMALIEDYLGIPYSLDKLDHVALNKNYGAAMENWGLITYNEDYLLHTNKHQGVKEIMTIAHEISHQWFGDLVSPEWWSYAWLNEGFATYFSHIFIDLLHPEYKSMEYFLTQTVERFYSYESHSHRSMTHYVEKEKNISEVFDIISYSKAACVIRMFHHAFNQKTFVRAIQLFLRKYQYSSANENNLFDCIQRTLEEDPIFKDAEWIPSVRNIMGSWTHTKRVPVVHVMRNYNDSTITIRQRIKNGKNLEHWWIPLNFATPSSNNINRTSVDYFMPPIQEVTLNLLDIGIELKPDDWLLVNKQQTGFYHLIYDNENLRKIALALQRNHLVMHEFNRAYLFNNMRSLIKDDEYSIEVILELLKYLANEDSLLVWHFALSGMEKLADHLHGTDSYELLKEFLREILGPIYTKLIAEIRTSEKSFNSLLNIAILRFACKLDIPECLEYTRHLSFDYIFQNIDFGNEPNDFLSFKDTVLCSAFSHLSNEEFDAVVRVMLSTDHLKRQYEDILCNLYCVESEGQARQYLELIFGPNSTQIVPNQNVRTAYIHYFFCKNVIARNIIWQYIADNYKTLVWTKIFIDIFNKLAMYVPANERHQFDSLHRKIKNELNAMGEEHSSGLIDINSPAIGEKAKKPLSQKVDREIHDWLLQNKLSHATYSVSTVNSQHNQLQQYSGGAQRFENSFRVARNLLKRLYSRLFYQ